MRVTKLAIVGCLFMAVSALANETPKDVFAEKERAIAAILQDRNLSDKARREKLIAEMRGSFDYQELARRSLGTNWEQLDAKQRSEFTLVLKELIEHSVLAKVKPVVDFSAEVVSELIKGTQATIASAVSTGSTTEPVRVEFQLTNSRDRGWVVYDMVIDDVSLLTSYRQQFSKIIRAESFESLMGKMNARLQKTRQQLAAAM